MLIDLGIATASDFVSIFDFFSKHLIPNDVCA
jgi:hypothetical protein